MDLPKHMTLYPHEKKRTKIKYMDNKELGQGWRSNRIKLKPQLFLMLIDSKTYFCRHSSSCYFFFYYSLLPDIFSTNVGHVTQCSVILPFFFVSEFRGSILSRGIVCKQLILELCLVNLKLCICFRGVLKL